MEIPFDIVPVVASKPNPVPCRVALSGTGHATTSEVSRVLLPKSYCRVRSSKN